MAVGGKATAHGAALLPGHPITPCSQIFVRTALDGPKEWTILEMQGEFEAREAGQEPVSYTHLTLPTILLV